MFALWPELFFLTPLAHALLRVAAGAIFLGLAWSHFSRRRALGDVRFIVVGSGAWIPVLAALIEAGVGGALVVGSYTQAAALLGALLALKHIVWKRTYPQFFTLSLAAEILLLAVCISLIATGAGAFSFDLPL